MKGTNYLSLGEASCLLPRIMTKLEFRIRQLSVMAVTKAWLN